MYHITKMSGEERVRIEKLLAEGLSVNVIRVRTSRGESSINKIKAAMIKRGDLKKSNGRIHGYE